jgi:TRAP-type C4-dicarboxylate transport system substrate-binding protein
MGHWRHFAPQKQTAHQSAYSITSSAVASSVWGPNDPQHEWAKRFAAAVEKDTGGRIKGEVYPASQLGSIPRQIEGVQFGSIQAWIGPPEFLVGVDERFEALSPPGLFTSREQDVRVINDLPVRDMMFGLGANKDISR